MSSEQKTRRQHYVPQFYLRNFSGDSDRQIYYFNKLTQRSNSAATKSVAWQDWFYDLRPEHFDEGSRFRTGEQVVENTLSKLENRFAAACEELIDTFTPGRHKDPKLSQNLKKELAYFLCVQLIRTNEFRELLKEAAEKDALGPEGRPNDGYHVDFTPENVAYYQTLLMFSRDTMPALIKTALSHRWYIGQNSTEWPLITSDSPVVHWNPKGERGLQSPGVHHFLPISPKLVIITVEPSAPPQLPALLRSGNRDVVKLGSESIRICNSLQVEQCSSHVYSQNNNFELAKALCKRFSDQIDKTGRRLVKSNE